VLGLFNFLCFAGYSLRNAARLSAYATAFASMAWALLNTCWTLVQGTSAKGKTGSNEADAGFLHSVLAPYFGWMRRFEDRFQDKLQDVRCSYPLTVIRNGDKKVGMQLSRLEDLSLGLEVVGIHSDGLVGEYIASPPTDKPLALPRVGDRLVRVNQQTIAPEMMSELANTDVQLLELEFSRIAEEGRHYQLWEVELEKAKADDIWGMHLVKLEELDGVAVKRVLAGSVVSRWNRKVASRGKKDLAVFPGDWILSCNKQLDASKFMDIMRGEKILRVGLIRWHSDTPLEEPVADEPQDVPEAEPVAELPQEPVGEAAPVLLGPPCGCCGLSGGRYVEMRCTAGEVHHFRTDCWRKKYNGLARKNAPTQCACGARVESIEVFERATQKEEARLIHTILSAAESAAQATEVAVAVERAERPREGARKRASSGRRAVQRVVPVMDEGEDAAPFLANPPPAAQAPAAQAPVAQAPAAVGAAESAAPAEKKALEAPAGAPEKAAGIAQALPEPQVRLAEAPRRQVGFKEEAATTKAPSKQLDTKVQAGVSKKTEKAAAGCAQASCESSAAAPAKSAETVTAPCQDPWSGGKDPWSQPAADPWSKPAADAWSKPAVDSRSKPAADPWSQFAAPQKGKRASSRERTAPKRASSRERGAAVCKPTHADTSSGGSPWAPQKQVGVEGQLRKQVVSRTGEGSAKMASSCETKQLNSSPEEFPALPGSKHQASAEPVPSTPCKREASAEPVPFTPCKRVSFQAESPGDEGMPVAAVARPPPPRIPDAALLAKQAECLADCLAEPESLSGVDCAFQAPPGLAPPPGLVAPPPGLAPPGLEHLQPHLGAAMLQDDDGDAGFWDEPSEVLPEESGPVLLYATTGAIRRRWGAGRQASAEQASLDAGVVPAR